MWPEVNDFLLNEGLSDENLRVLKRAEQVSYWYFFGFSNHNKQFVSVAKVAWCVPGIRPLTNLNPGDSPLNRR